MFDTLHLLSRIYIAHKAEDTDTKMPHACLKARHVAVREDIKRGLNQLPHAERP